jgi:hypothetical protein
MPPFDGKAMAADVLAAVREFFTRSVAPLEARFTAMESRVAGMPDMILAEFAISPKMAEQIKQAVAEFTESRKDADVRAIAEMLNERVLQIPKPKDGTSVGVEDIRPLVVEEISNSLALVPKPKDGAPGRDAAQIEVAAEIDEAKSYPRGTYAKHANGLWRAFEHTQGMRGWECLVAGVAGIEVLCNHEREFQVVHTLSDGKQFAQTFELPVLIYRGVFAEGREYHRGDQVSWGAHQWHCNAPTTEKPIEGGKAWTLAVKRGRDGKEGPAGPAGKDRIVVKEKA